MASPLSVGDCIAIAHVIITVVRALSGSYGAAAEYQALENELGTLAETLHSISEIQWDSTEGRPHVVQRTVDECKYLLDDFQRQIAKFRIDLGADASKRSFVRITLQKIRWSFTLKRKLSDLRSSVARHVAVLNLQLPFQNLQQSSACAESTGRTRRILQHRLNHHSHGIENIRQELVFQSRVVSATNDALEAITPRNEAFKGNLAGLLSDHDVLLRAVQNLQLSLKPDIAHSWFQPPIRFEDALGQIISLPFEYDYHDLDSLILSWFQPRTDGMSKAGLSEVQARAYEPFDSTNSKRLITSANYADVKTPGMGITMGFVVGIFFLQHGGLIYCPRPGCTSKQLKPHRSGGNLCSDCPAWFDTAAAPLPKPPTPAFACQFSVTLVTTSPAQPYSPICMLGNIRSIHKQSFLLSGDHNHE